MITAMSQVLRCMTAAPAKDPEHATAEAFQHAITLYEGGQDNVQMPNSVFFSCIRRSVQAAVQQVLESWDGCAIQEDATISTWTPVLQLLQLEFKTGPAPNLIHTAVVEDSLVRFFEGKSKK